MGNRFADGVVGGFFFLGGGCAVSTSVTPKKVARSSKRIRKDAVGTGICGQLHGAHARFSRQ